MGDGAYVGYIGPFPAHADAVDQATEDFTGPILWNGFPNPMYDAGMPGASAPMGSYGA